LAAGMRTERVRLTGYSCMKYTLLYGLCFAFAVLAFSNCQFAHAQAYWAERLWYVGPKKSEDRNYVFVADNILLTVLERDVRVKASNVIKTEWKDSGINWGGHLEKEEKWPAKISFNLSRPDGNHSGKDIKQTLFLSVVVKDKKPTLVLTADSEKANNWTMDLVSSESIRSEPEENRWGYIRVIDGPQKDLWLSVSGDPVLVESYWKNDINFCLQLIVDDKKDSIFFYSRFPPSGK
jgi:hypothetical protein